LAIHGTTTGRLTDKMWLLIPRTGTNRFTERLRYLVLPDPGHVLLHIDYDQAELRVVTVEAQDEIYRSVFLVGGDPHAATADDLFGPGWRDLPPDQAKEKRTHAKTVNFGILYGQGARGMAESAGVPVNVAQAWLARYWATHTAIKDWADNIRHQVHTSGIIETHFGRKRRYTLILDDKTAADIEREAVNFPIQSTAAELLYLSAIETAKRPDMPRLVLLNHDAMLLSCQPERAELVLAELQEIMARVPREQYTDYIPFTADASYGASWGDCK
jgi:DNA polymerase-1